jgi:transcriptional regulator with XRE-family HTH domain
MTESFGSRLRRERERKQITLADIAASTKIKASLFDALERDDVSHWPSGIFRRSFMRAYAKAIGLDADATVGEFLQCFPDPAAVDAAAPAPAPPGAGGLLAAGVAPPATEAPRVRQLAAVPPPPSHTLRLTLVETGLPFTGGRFLADAKRRWSAAAWDLGSLVAIAVSVFVFMDAFWMPFGVTALCYYVGGVLLLGNSPGVCLFAPKPSGGNNGESVPSKGHRPRPVESPQMRPAETVFEPTRFRAERKREARK